MLAFVPLPPWYTPTQPPACQLTLNVTKPCPFRHLAAKIVVIAVAVVVVIAVVVTIVAGLVVDAFSEKKYNIYLLKFIVFHFKMETLCTSFRDIQHDRLGNTALIFSQ